MIKKITMILAIIIVVFIVIVSMQPGEFRVTRSATISAPPSDVFVYVNDLHNWNTWSPWAKLDPNAKATYQGPATGTGASFKWEGNEKLGVGIMTITESKTNELVRFKLEFIKPFTATNIAEFTFQPQGNQTLVTWSMFGKNSFIGKAMGLLMNCDKMVGGQFEQGLAQLKSIVEKKSSQ